MRMNFEFSKIFEGLPMKLDKIFQVNVYYSLFSDEYSYLNILCILLPRLGLKVRFHHLAPKRELHL